MRIYMLNPAMEHKLAGQGFSAVQIGEQLGVSRMTVARRLAEGKRMLAGM